MNFHGTGHSTEKLAYNYETPHHCTSKILRQICEGKETQSCNLSSSDKQSKRCPEFPIDTFAGIFQIVTLGQGDVNFKFLFQSIIFTLAIKC